MKHKFLFMLPLVAAMLISCGGQKGKSEDQSGDSKDTTSEVSEPADSEEESQPGESEEESQPGESESQPGESEEIVPLGAPVLELNADKDGLTWLDVDGAVSYELKVNEEAPVAATEYKFWIGACPDKFRIGGGGDFLR